MPESPEESQIQTLKPTHKRCLSGGIQSSKTISSEITLEMGEEFKDKIHKEFGPTFKMTYLKSRARCNQSAT